ncbi:MAG TPA: Uma2 family endonuclease [Gemmatimonadales bacterium]|nr:Uma2 family endonuclease [Gemmatimonadales bacterium]
MTSRAAVRNAFKPKPTVSFEEFLELTTDQHAEWVEGEILPMAAVSIEHTQITAFLLALIRAYVEEHDLGMVAFDPFVMKTGPDLPARAPDIMFIAKANLGRLRDMYLEGPADLVVEVVSRGSRTRDRVHKFAEYETGGVAEYWVVDPKRRWAAFYLRDAEGRYRAQEPTDGKIQSDVLPRFWIRREWIWERPRVAEALAEIGR